MNQRARTWPLYAVLALGLAGLVLTLRLVATARLDQRATLAYAAADANGLFTLGIDSVTAPDVQGRWPARLPANPPVHDVASYGLVTFAAVGEQTLGIFDARAPDAPTLRDVVKVADFNAIRVEVDLGLAAVLDPDKGVQLFDVGDPFLPTLLGALSPRRDETFAAMILQPPLLYVVGNQGMRIADLGDPAAPEWISAVGADAEIRDLDVAEGIAYLLGSDSVAIVDVGDPNEPKLLGGANLSTKNAASIAYVDAGAGAGKHVYIGAVMPPTGGSGGLHAVNVDDPSKPVAGQTIEDNFSFHDLVAQGRLLHGAAGLSGMRIYDVTEATPSFLGQVTSQWAFQRLTLQRDMPKATPTPSRPTLTATRPASPTFTPTLRATATLTPTETTVPRDTPTPRESATPTATDERKPTETSTPPATITRVRPPTPSPTVQPGRGTATPTVPAPPDRWTIARPPADVASALDRVRGARFDAGGTLWLRLPGTNGGDDLIISRRGETWRRFGNLRDVLRARYDEILDRGTLPDFWAVDDAGRVWVGPAHFDGVRFTPLATNEDTPAGSFTYEPRTIIDRTGRAWVPFHARVSCPNPAGCRKVGVRLLNPEGGVELDLEVEPLLEAGEYGIPDVMLLHSRTQPGGTDVADVAGGTSGFDAATAAQGDEQSYVVTSRALYIPPSTEPIPYPLLDELGETQRNAGYATSSTVDPEGRPLVITWVEEHVGEAPRTIQWRVMANTWTGTEWQTQDLSTSPVFADGLEFLRGTAVAFAPDGSLWLGSSEGEVAVWRDGAWAEHFTSDNSPLPAGQPITGITISGTGTVWCVTPTGVYAYESQTGEPPAPIIYLPFARQSK